MPIRPISWQRALTLLTLGKVEVVEEYEDAAKSATMIIRIPAVVRLLRSFRPHKKAVKFSRANIFARDGHKCQYCGNKKKVTELTYDHVLPRSHGGKTTWTNIVTACGDCNLRKGGRTPEQARMRLLSIPVQPKWIPAMTIAISTKSIPDAWRDYVYWTGTLTEDE